MTSTTHPAALAADRIAQLRHRDSALRRGLLEVRAWALGRGIPVEVDGLTVVLGCLATAEATEGVDRCSWTSARVLEFVWAQCPLWCLDRGVPIPRSTSQALRLWWAFLGEHGRFAAGSDEPTVLEQTLTAHAGRPPRRPTRVPPEHIGLP